MGKNSGDHSNMGGMEISWLGTCQLVGNQTNRAT